MRTIGVVLLFSVLLASCNSTAGTDRAPTGSTGSVSSSWSDDSIAPIVPATVKEVPAIPEATGTVSTDGSIGK